MRSETFTIATPHPDIENHRQRQPFRYIVTWPDHGVDDQTGLVMTIGGYGSSLEQEYDVLLRRYLASKYNCLAVSVEYFGQKLKTSGRPLPLPDFFVNLHQHHGVSVTADPSTDISLVVAHLLTILARQGVTELDRSCRILMHVDHEYQSFGFLPALDHLQVLAEILRREPVNRARIFLQGTSYGGYIALLMGKYAPQTFAMIADNSGFVVPNNDILGASLYRCTVNGVALFAHEPNVWSIDPASPTFFASHHRKIRSLLVRSHMTESATNYQLWHYCADRLVPVHEKQRFAELLRPHAPVSLTVVTDDAIDGVLFKSREHGMGASLRHLFDRSYAAYLATKPSATQTESDFDRASRYRFGCGDRSYQFAYSLDDGVRVDLI